MLLWKTCNPEMERLGLTKKVVQATVEQRLRRMKIKVLGKPKPPALSTLYIVVKTFNVKPRGILVYGINVMLMEYAYLKREVGSVGDLREVRAINWFKGTVGYVGPPSPLRKFSRKLKGWWICSSLITWP
jgi:hypothetical protein